MIITISCSITLGFALAFTEPASVDALRRNKQYNCGDVALWHLLRLEGRDVSVERIRAAMPRVTSQGPSLGDLRVAAKRLGVDLLGIRLGLQPDSLDRPALVSTNDSRGGHFLVVRPVGHSGRLLQVLDIGVEPEVTDGERIFKSQSWTGIALVVDRVGPWNAALKRFVFLCLIFTALLTPIVWIIAYLRRTDSALDAKPSRS